MEEIKSLSLIVPTYCQEKTISHNIKSLNQVLSALSLDYEIIVVVDGIMDRTYSRAQRLISQNIKVLKYKENKGKGYAVRYGMTKAKGDVVGFIDGGMDIDPTGISMLLNHMVWYNADIIIGSKLHPVSQVNYPLVRKIMSWGYRTFTHLLFGFKVKDTQVGIKLFKKKVAKDVFPRLIVNNFAFDIEVLAVAYSLGYKRIYEAPVKLHFTNVSSITSQKFIKVISQMIADTLGTYYRLKIINYYGKKPARKRKKLFKFLQSKI